MKNYLILIFLSFSLSSAQNGYWQQQADYTMSIDVDVENFTYSGEQSLVYTNNSPDTLQRVFYHLYYNAFKPGSDLEAASRNSYNDRRSMSKRLLSLDKNDWGDVKVLSLKQDAFSGFEILQLPQFALVQLVSNFASYSYNWYYHLYSILLVQDL